MSRTADHMTHQTVSQRDLRNRSGEIMRAVEAGETFVITSHGRAIAELRPLQEPKQVLDDNDVALFLAGVGPEGAGVTLDELRALQDDVADSAAYLG